MMKLYYIRPRKDLSSDNPWKIWYDKAFGFVIRAETELEARKIAQENGGDETYFYDEKGEEQIRDAWVDSKYSTCEELVAEGDAGLVMKDYSSA